MLIFKRDDEGIVANIRRLYALKCELQCLLIKRHEWLEIGSISCHSVLQSVDCFWQGDDMSLGCFSFDGHAVALGDGHEAGRRIKSHLDLRLPLFNST